MSWGGRGKTEEGENVRKINWKENQNKNCQYSKELRNMCCS